MNTYLRHLPSDLLMKCILDNFSPVEIIGNMSVFTLFPNIVNQYFWKALWIRDISTIDIPSIINYDLYRSVIEDDEFRETEEAGIIVMNMDRISYFATKGYDVLLYSLIRDEQDYNWAVDYFSMYGHASVVENILKESVDKKFTIDYDMGLCGAAAGGNMRLANLMLSLGATDYHNALVWSAMGRNEDVVSLMLKLLNDVPFTDKLPIYNRALAQAAGEGDKNIVNKLLELGANDYNLALEWAACKNQDDIVDWMINLGATSYNRALCAAAFYGNLSIIKRMINLGATAYNKAFKRAVAGISFSIDNNKCNILEFFLTLPITNYNTILAHEKNNKFADSDLIKFLESHQPINF